MLARQLRRDPNPEASEDAAAALEALAIERERTPGAPEVVSGGDSGLNRLRPATVLRKLTVLSSLYGEFVALGAARRNPVEEIERPDCPGSGGRRKPEQTGRGCRARTSVQKIASSCDRNYTVNTIE